MHDRSIDVSDLVQEESGPSDLDPAAYTDLTLSKLHTFRIRQARKDYQGRSCSAPGSMAPTYVPRRMRRATGRGVQRQRALALTCSSSAPFGMAPTRGARFRNSFEKGPDLDLVSKIGQICQKIRSSSPKWLNNVQPLVSHPWK